MNLRVLDVIELDVQVAQRLRCDAVSLAHEAQKEALGANRVAGDALGCFLGKALCNPAG
jgi:hypothetical protein